MNDIDKLDGMIKIKGKCGYEIIGGCRELRTYKQALQEIKAIAEDAYENDSKYQATGVYNEIIQKITKAEEE